MMKTVLYIILISIFSLTVVSCSSSSGGGSSTTTTTYSLEGTLTYDYVPATSSYGALDYNNITTKPIRGAKIKLIDSLTGSTLATVASSSSGTYSFSGISSSSVKLVIYAQMVTPSVIIEDNTNSDAVYGGITAAINLETDNSFDVNIPSGWSGSAASGSYSSPRMAAPFAILDYIYTSVAKFLSARPSISFPELKVNWSIDNIASSGDKSEGNIGTSHWDSSESELYILGKADSDTDEYDTHIIVHEWGHYFESKLGRSDSIGGSHGTGDVLDPRVAFGEGFGNALSAMMLYPNITYFDTGGTRQQSGWGMNLESGSNSSNPGWFSETSVQLILFDLFDSDSDTNDTVSLGIGPIYDVMVGEQKTTSSFTTLFSFISALKTANSSSATAIDTVVNARGISTIADAWGTGESYNGGLSTNLPVYNTLTIGSSLNVTLVGGYSSSTRNELSNNRLFKFTGNGSTVAVTAQTSGGSGNNRDVELVVYKDGVLLGYSDSRYVGTETVSISTISGAVYTIWVRDFNPASDNYTVTMGVN
jgi:hypothetical protein